MHTFQCIGLNLLILQLIAFFDVANRTPFQITFRSDRYEPIQEVTAIAAAGANPGTTAAGNNGGFELGYFMDAIGCNSAALVG